MVKEVMFVTVISTTRKKQPVKLLLLPLLLYSPQELQSLKHATIIHQFGNDISFRLHKCFVQVWLLQHTLLKRHFSYYKRKFCAIISDGK